MPKPSTEEVLNGWLEMADRAVGLNKHLFTDSQKQLAQSQKQYRKANPHVARNSALKRMQRMPQWADKQKIADIYCSREDGMHIDHIIPLCGKKVSGLHVHNNLQTISAHENLTKHNKYEVNDA